MSCDCQHSNPMCRCATDGWDRAREFSKFVDALEAGGIDPDRLRFMPLGEDKRPAIEGRARLESEEADLLLMDVEEAYLALANGHGGFALYFGREDHGTENLVSVDNDEPEFPEDAMPETGLRVMSGSGNFPGHYYSLNDGTVQNSAPSFGEVRARNYYTVVPGSTHPSGGVYHAVDTDAPTELSQADLPESLHPRSNTRSSSPSGEAVELSPPEELADAEFTNEFGWSLEQIRERDDDLDSLLSRLTPGGYSGDTSRADAATVRHLAFWGFERQQVADILRRHRNREKLNRQDYVDRTIDFAFDGETLSDTFDPREQYDPATHAILPQNRRTLGVGAGWNWHGASDEPTITKDEVHERVMNHVREVRKYGDNALLDAMMSTGKTESTFRVAGEDGQPTSYFTSRRDLYEQGRELAEEFVPGNAYILPSADQYCPTFKGEHGEAIEERVRDLRARGVNPKTMHERLDLPCCHGEEGKCPYEAMWQFDPDEFDVLIGHYGHAYLPFVTAGRHVVVDEYPEDSLTTTLAGEQLEKAVNAFCERESGFPFTDYHEVVEWRNQRDSEKMREALAWFDAYDWEKDEQGVLASEDYHAYAPWAIYVLLTATPVGDANPGYNFERATLPDENKHIGVFERGTEWDIKAVHLQTPPDVGYARSVLALDGTPNKTLWERALGVALNVREPLASDAEKRAYIRETLGIEGVLVNDSTKPYSSGEYVTEQQDANVTSAAAQQYADPVVFSTKKAIGEYTEAWRDDSDDPVSEATVRAGEDPKAPLSVPAKALDNFENLRGTNRYKSERCAVIHGSPNYGDAWVKRKAAFENVAVFPEREESGRDYGEANQIAEQMREAVVAQASLRVGRDGNGAVVVFNTSAVPDWFPILGTGSVLKTYSEGQRQVLDALRHLSEIGEADITAPDIAEHPSVDIGYEAVLKNLHQFAERGLLDVERSGRSYVWTPDGLHEVTPRGDVSLPTIDADEAFNRDGELSHNVVYMPKFTLGGPNCDHERESHEELSTFRVNEPGERVADGPPPT